MNNYEPKKCGGKDSPSAISLILGVSARPIGAVESSSRKYLLFPSVSCCAREERAAWRNAKHRQQWENTLATYVYPMLGDLPVSAIDPGLVVQVLDPIWTEKPETASRVRGRIEAVLDAATVRAMPILRWPLFTASSHWTGWQAEAQKDIVVHEGSLLPGAEDHRVLSKPISR